MIQLAGFSLHLIQRKQTREKNVDCMFDVQGFEWKQVWIKLNYIIVWLVYNMRFKLLTIILTDSAKAVRKITFQLSNSVPFLKRFFFQKMKLIFFLTVLQDNSGIAVRHLEMNFGDKDERLKAKLIVGNSYQRLSSRKVRKLWALFTPVISDTSAHNKSSVFKH